MNVLIPTVNKVSCPISLVSRDVLYIFVSLFIYNINSHLHTLYGRRVDEITRRRKRKGFEIPHINFPPDKTTWSDSQYRYINLHMYMDKTWSTWKSIQKCPVWQNKLQKPLNKHNDRPLRFEWAHVRSCFCQTFCRKTRKLYTSWKGMTNKKIITNQNYYASDACW